MKQVIGQIVWIIFFLAVLAFFGMGTYQWGVGSTRDVVNIENGDLCYKLAETPVPLKAGILLEWEIKKCYPELAIIISCEGGWDNPRICNQECGCDCGMGLAQFIPSTWKYVKEKIRVYDPFNKEQNLRAALWLYVNEGKRHWLQSKECWEPKIY